MSHYRGSRDCSRTHRWLYTVTTGNGQQPSGTASSGVIKVGVIASLTGPASNVGTNMWNSAQVAADKINADGGVTLKDGSKAQIKLISVTRINPAGRPEGSD